MSALYSKFINDHLKIETNKQFLDKQHVLFFNIEIKNIITQNNIYLLMLIYGSKEHLKIK